jgi:hypothetical protein
VVGRDVEVAGFTEGKVEPTAEIVFEEVGTVVAVVEANWGFETCFGAGLLRLTSFTKPIGVPKQSNTKGISPKLGESSGIANCSAQKVVRKKDVKRIVRN